MAVRIARPEEDSRDATIWCCRVEFLGFPGRSRLLRHALGVDQVQALLSALQLIESELARLRQAREQMTWLGDSDLGFPRFEQQETPAPRQRSGRTPGQKSLKKRSPTRR
jgi:hypothetical protein